MTFLRARDTFRTSSISRKTLTLTSFFFFFHFLRNYSGAPSMFSFSRPLSFFIRRLHRSSNGSFRWWIDEKCSPINRIAFHSAVRHAATDWTAYIKLLIPNAHSHTHTTQQWVTVSNGNITMSMHSIHTLFFHFVHTIRFCFYFHFFFVRFNDTKFTGLHSLIYYVAIITLTLSLSLFWTANVEPSIALKWFIFRFFL